MTFTFKILNLTPDEFNRKNKYSENSPISQLGILVWLSVTPWILQVRVLEWAAVPFSRGSSQPRGRTQVFLIVGGFFTSWATREAHKSGSG